MNEINLNGIKIRANDITDIAKNAGKAVLKIYQDDFEVFKKQDSSHKEGFSPLTKADLESNQVIKKGLANLYPNIPVLSEESKQIPYNERKSWEYFWLIDPLDGTKNFINRDGEFTINIALINKKKPILGVVYAPVKEIVYFGDSSNGSFKQIKDSEPIRLTAKPNNSDRYIVVASKNHFTKETEEFIESLKKQHKNIELISIGSSMKFCLVAEGNADIYPRFGPTMEWDTAAAHAVVKFAGKNVYACNSEKELEYNKENLLNPWFIVK